MNEDWELGALFLKEVDGLGSEEAAAESPKEVLRPDLRPDHDTRFFVGVT